MSIRLTVKMRAAAGGADKAQTVLLDDEVITLGRDQNCQVVLAQSAVSRNHARISKDGTLFFVEDLGSSYGTTINGNKLPKGEKRLLRNGDTICIAQFDVVFDRVADVADDVSGKTMFVSRNLVKDVMKGIASGESPYLRVMNGPMEGTRIEVPEATELIMGRDEQADIVLADDLVSRKHVKVRRDWSGTHVEDLGSRNGIRLNKKKTRKATLKDRDEVEIGGVRLLFIDPNEVRETPLVLPSEDEAESTQSVKSDDEEAPAAGAKGEAPAEEPAPEEEPAAEEPPAEEEPDAEEPAAEEPGGEMGGFGEDPSNTSEDDGPPAAMMGGPGGYGGGQDAGDEGGGGLIDLKNKQTLIVLAVAGVLGLAALVVIILALAGA